MNPTLARCKVCKKRPSLHKDGVDSDFFACDCIKEGLYSHVIYSGWDLPSEWKLNWFTRLRYWLVKHIEPTKEIR